MVGSSRGRVRARPGGHRSERHGKGWLAAGLSVALLLAYCTPEAHMVYAAPSGRVQTAAPATPNRFDPTSRATSARPRPAPATTPAPASGRAAGPHHPPRLAG